MVFSLYSAMVASDTVSYTRSKLAGIVWRKDSAIPVATGSSRYIRRVANFKRSQVNSQVVKSLTQALHSLKVPSLMNSTSTSVSEPSR